MTTTAPISTLITPTTGEARSRERIEQAVTDTPFCEACGATTLPVAEGDQIWLTCAGTREPRTMLRRLFTLEALVGHTRVLVIENLPEQLAA